jgi:hypothetical protein
VEDAFRNIDIHPSDYHLLVLLGMGFIIMTNVYQWVLLTHVKFLKIFPVHYNG